MTEVYTFNTANMDKYFVGADKIAQNLAKVHAAACKSIPGYPPYNIMKVDENKYVIEMAVAGFAKQNLEIEVANSVLTVKGGLTVDDMAQESVANTQYIYKGIADRAFTRKMQLADTVVVQNAELINGMLRVFLENIIPESQKPQKVNIK